MQDGVCENFTGGRARALPRRAPATATDNRGISFVEPEALKGYVTELDRLGFQVHFHALAERAVREAPRRDRGGPASRTARATTATTSPTSRSCTPTTSRGSGALGAVANAQPLWAAHEAQMDELTIPFLGEPRWRWQYPFASLVRAGASARDGQRLERVDPRPAARRCTWPSTADARRLPATRSSAARSSCPDERLDLPTAIAGFTIGSAYVNHLDDRDRVDRGRQARRPRGDRPEPVRPPGRRDRGGDGRRRPSSRASAVYERAGA